MSLWGEMMFTAPIKKDEIAGKFLILLNNQLLFEENLYNIYDVDTMSFMDNLKDIIENM